MSTLSLFYCPSSTPELVTLRLGRTPEAAQTSLVAVTMPGTGTPPLKKQVTIDFCPGRHKDVLFAFNIEADKYHARLDKIGNAASSMKTSFQCGTEAEWTHFLRAWLVHPHEVELR